MASYYCIMTGLPELSLTDTRPAYTISRLKEDCEELLTDSDRQLLFYFFLKADCRNLVRLLKHPDADFDPNGNYNLEQYLELIHEASISEFDIPKYPSFMADFVRSYHENIVRPDYFADDAMMQMYYEYSTRCKNEMMADWYTFNFNLTNILTALIARKNGWNVGDYVLGDNEISEMLRINKSKDFDLTREYDYVAELMKIADETDPVEKERQIDVMKWQWLDDRTFFDTFSIEAVFAYFCKLEMLERWEHLDVEEGKETFRQIIEQLRGEAKVPEEFIRK